MSKKKKDKPGDTAGGMNWHAWAIRAALLSVLIFIFVAWRLYPIVGNTAFLWAMGLGGAILAWFGVSYYILNR